MKRAAATAIAVCLLSALAGGCGVPDQSTPSVVTGAGLAPEHHIASSSTSAQWSTSQSPVVAYFISSDNSHLVAAKQVHGGSGLSAALGSLLAGPSSAEAAAGLSTAIPDKTKLNSTDLHGSVAYLDFSNSLAAVSGQEQLLAFAQIVVTATSVPGVQAVVIAIGKQVVDPPLSDGTLAQGPVSRASYASLLPPGS